MGSLTVVRVKTSCWASEGQLHYKRSVTVLKKKSSGDNWGWEIEDIWNMLTDKNSESNLDQFARITNLLDVQDGIYEIDQIDISKDRETGHDEDWNYRLVPYQELGEGNVE